MKPLTHKQQYLEELATADDLKFIDEHDFVERVYTDLPVLLPVKPCLWRGIVTNGTIAAFTGWAFSHLSLLLGVAAALAYLALWFGSMGDRENA